MSTEHRVQSYFPYYDTLLKVPRPDKEVIVLLEALIAKSEETSSLASSAQNRYYGKIYGHSFVLYEDLFRSQMVYEGQVIGSENDTILLVRTRWPKWFIWFWVLFLLLGVFGGWNRSLFESYYLGVLTAFVLFVALYFLVPLINGNALMRCLWQRIQSKSITSKFSETT
jgi:hypothetical protein